MQGAVIKLLPSLILNCGQRQYQSKIWIPKYETYTPLLLIFSLVSIMASSYKDLCGFKWSEECLRSATDFLTKLPRFSTSLTAFLSAVQVEIEKTP